MTVKKRYADLLTGTSHVGGGAVSGEARANIGLGAAYARVLGFEFKGDDADGGLLLVATAFDAGGTTSDEYTEQEAAIGTTVSAASTVGVFRIVGYPEALYVDAAGDASADTEGMVAGG